MHARVLGFHVPGHTWQLLFHLSQSGLDVQVFGEYCRVRRHREHPKTEPLRTGKVHRRVRSPAVVGITHAVIAAP